MTALEWLFNIDKEFDITKPVTKGSYYTVDSDNDIVVLKVKEWFQNAGDTDDIYSVLSVCLDTEDDDLNRYGRWDDYVFIPYENLAFLQGITVEGDITKFDSPCQRNQLVCIRGTCDHRCPDCIPEYNGYALREIPSCDRQLVGTSVWTAKYATIMDILQDVFFWMRYCKGLDVLVINFDFTPYEDSPDLSYRFICFAAHIQGNSIKFITSPKECQKLFEGYSLKYACTDYEIEKSISDWRGSWQFSFLKPHHV